ncbi:MAG: hypothetical protein V1740_00900 [Candidatus Woesearchaeota archaeon]
MNNAQEQQFVYNVRQGALKDIYGLFVPSTINTGAQLSAARIAGEGLRRVWFYTANAPLATKRDGKLLLGIGGNAAFNVVFGEGTSTVCQELAGIGYVHLNSGQKDLILRLEQAGDVVFVDPKGLRLKGSDAEYRSFHVRTGRYDKDVTVARVPWVSAGYGSGYMLERVMDNLRVNGRISETRVFTMNPDHAAESIKDDEIVARASRLNGFVNNSNFNANFRDVSDHDALRGVLLGESAKGGEKNSPLETLVGKG